ncbi:MAG: HTH-type transcriptional activator IlvY [Pseudomonadota bacterium]
MDFRALSVFLSVAETLNFSRSAELLHMSVSAVSRTVQRLEEEAGQPLMERDRRNVRLTAAGREFLDYARRALDDWQQMRRKLGKEGELSGEVSLYCSVTASHRVLAPVLSAYRARHPAVDIMLHTGDQADGIGRALSGQDDVAVSGYPDQLSSRLEFLPLTDSPMRFCISADDCQVRRLALPAYGELDWDRLPLIVPERGVTQVMLDDWLASQGIRPRIYAQVAGHEAIVAMVALGLGVGIAPDLVVEASGMQDRVDYLEVDEPLPPLRVGLCSLSQRLRNPLVASFWEVAGETYGVI